MENNQELISSESGQTEFTIKKSGKVLHFSDGVDENVEEDHISELQAPPSDTVDNVDPKTLPWAPWFSYYAWKSGTTMLNAVDYAGESLANFFGITTPKYQLEIDEYERVKEEKRKIEEESAGWVPQNAGGDVPLVLSEPSKVLQNPSSV